MTVMFQNAFAFNQNIGNWNTSAVVFMSSVFSGATAFNQNLGNWQLNSNVNMSGMLDNCGMDCSNYSATLNGWATNPLCPNGRTLGATGMQYNTTGATAITILNSKGWTVSGHTSATSVIWYLDVDADGYYTNTQSACISPGAGWTSTLPGGGSGDCAPNDNSKWQSASLYIDNDNDNYDNGAATVCYGASVPSGYKASSLGSDCNDNDGAVHTAYPFYADTDGDGVGAGSSSNQCAVNAGTPPTGYSLSSTDCAPSDNTKWQSASLYLDNDNDNYDNGTATVCYGASIPAGYKAATLGTDCNDNDGLLTTNCGAVNTWLGNTTQWSANGNWSFGTAPTTCSDNVLIPTSPSGTLFPTIGLATFTAGDVTVQQGATITINGAGGLQVCGDLNGTGSGGTIAGNSTNGVILTGSSAQSISGTLSVNALKVNNTGSGVTVSGNLNVNTSFVMLDGDFTNSGGSVTLKSNAVTTAYLDNFTSGTAGIYNGMLTVERYINNNANGYRDISSPVSTTVAGLADDFSVFGQNGVQCWYAYNPYPNVQVYNEALSLTNGSYYEGWLSYTGSSNQLTAMKGIAVRTYQGSPFTLDLSGTPNNGPQSINITKTASATPTQDGWNFVGNAYPSNISWSAVKALNVGKTDAAYYVFQTTGEYTGNWGSHNGVAGVNGAGNEIAVMQGFFVLSTGNHSLEMNNTVRTTNAATFYKTDALDNEVRLTLSDGTNSDEVVTYTDFSTTTGYDPDHDAAKMAAGSTVYMSYKLLGKEYAINVINDIAPDTELPLLLWAETSGTYTLTANVLNTPGLIAFLKDNQSGSLTNLSIAPALINLTGGQSYDGIYSIVFQPEVLTGIVKAEPLTQFYSNGSTIYINRTSTEKAEITVTNVLGQQLAQVNSQQERTVIEMSKAEPAYVIVKVKEGSKTTVGKVMIR